MFQQFLYHHPRAVSPSALLFPAVNSRRRFLIHNTVQEYFPGLTTVSVGHGEQRRTVVTFRNSAEDAQEAAQHRPSKQKQEEQKEEEIGEGGGRGGRGGGGRRREAAAGAAGAGSAGGGPEERLPKNEDRRDDATTKAAKLQHHQQCPQQKQAPPAQQQQQQHSRGSQQHKGPQQQAEQRQQQQRKGSQHQLNNVGPQQQQQKQQLQEQQQQQQQTSGKQRQRSRKARSRSCHSEPRNGGRQRQQQQQQQQQQQHHQQQHQQQQQQQQHQQQQKQQHQGNSGGGGGPKHDERQVREDTPPEDSQSKKRRNRRNRKQRERQEQLQQQTQPQQAEHVNGRHEDEDERDNPVPYRAGHNHHRGGNHAFERRGAAPVRASGGESEWDLCARGVEGHVSESGGKANRVKTESESDKTRNSNAGQGNGGGPTSFREDGGDLRLFLNSRREILAQSRSAEASSAGGRATSSNAAHDHHRMPVTMTSDDYSGNNSRPRGKACAQIYRPPPARSTRLDAGPVQQQQLYHPKQQQQHNHYYQHTQHSPQNNQYPQHQYPLPNRQRTDSESSYVMGDHQGGKAGRGRRPDQMLYVPRGRRNMDSGSVRGTPTPMQDYEQSQRAPSPTFSICSVVSEYSGRNRYSKHDSRHGSQISIYDGDFDRIKSKPPLSKGEFSRESTPGNGRQKGGNRFNSQTLQLIERCLNQDSEPRLSDNRNWDSDSVHSSPAKNNRGGRGRNQKSPTPTRDIHSVHSKENVIHPVEPNSRTRKGRRNRRRNSRSREPSAEKYNDSTGSPGCNSKNGDPYNSPHSERGFGSCERVFYNSNFNSPNERYDRGYDNYDRYSSINNSRASSRNSSRERTPQHASYHTNWRGASSPSSPAKGYQSRNSPGKPPSGRLGSLPNVTLDYSENTRRSPTPSNEENYRYHTLPVKHNRNPLMGSHRANSIDNSRISGIPNSHRLDQSYHDEPSYSSMETVDQGPSLINGGSAEHRLENINENPSFDSSYSSDQNIQMSRVEEMHVCEDISQGSAHDTSSNGEVIEANQTTLPSDPAETDSKNGQPLHVVDNQSNVNAVSDEPSSTAAGSSGKVYFDLGDEAEDTPEALAREAVAIENDTQNDIQAEAKEEASEQEKEEKKNLKKFSFNWADEVEDSWDTLYDDSGECLDPEIKRQLSDSIGKVKLVKPSNDYYDYQPKEPQINEDEYAHVIEIYDFPVSFKTQDLMMIFSPYQNNGFDIKWVDDTHALGIFATALIAKEALSIDHPFLKARSLSLATETSRSKAMRITEALLPYKPRPATSAALARRLVSGALGLKVNVPHEVREAERQKLKDAKAQKKLAAKQRSDAWEGTLT